MVVLDVLVDDVVVGAKVEKQTHEVPSNVGRPALQVGGGVVLIPEGHELGGYMPETYRLTPDES